MWAKYLMLLIETNIKYLALLDALIFNTKYKANLPEHTCHLLISFKLDFTKKFISHPFIVSATIFNVLLLF